MLLPLINLFQTVISGVIHLFQNVVFQTVISGMFIFVLSQYILKFILEPLQEYKKIIAKIDNKLKFYSNVIVNPPFTNQLPEDYLMAKKDLRELSCDLESLYKSLPFQIFRRNRKKISEAAKNLILLSNITEQWDETSTVNLSLKAGEKIETIRKNLGIPEI